MRRADAVKPMPPTPEPQLLEALRQLNAKKDAWVAMSDGDKARLLRYCLKTTQEVRRRVGTRF